MLTSARLTQAYLAARRDLLAERTADGHWVGQLSSSALSTATAISALAAVANARREEPSPLIERGLAFLATQQNEDGGWGDTPLSHSNIATTMLVRAAVTLAGRREALLERMDRAEQYVAQRGGISGLRARYGRDKTFAVPILANCALAGLVPWRKVSHLPFELACLPQRWYRLLRLPVVSYAIPALVAIGQLRWSHHAKWNPLKRLRARAIEPSLSIITNMQPPSGGYLEAIPLTSFVVMSLASTGRHDHPITRNGVRFLNDSARSDGSWPIDTNLATWNTTLALNALASGRENLPAICGQTRPGEGRNATSIIDWVLNCQHRRTHAFTGAEPGGWGWSDLSGAVPDADDTSGALLALAAWRASRGCGKFEKDRIDEAAQAGLAWLLDLQNDDGGWPTFCRGWGKLPFDRSGTDLTAHAMRAIYAWREEKQVSEKLLDRMATAIERGDRFLSERQERDGRWTPLWFGNQDDSREENPVYGTAQVLKAYRDGGGWERPAARRGIDWLARAQHDDGSWGGVEETALAIEALSHPPLRQPHSPALRKGLDWLIRAVETRDHLKSAPIGLYFARLWYYEKLYPLVFAVSALGRALAASRFLPLDAM